MWAYSLIAGLAVTAAVAGARNVDDAARAYEAAHVEYDAGQLAAYGLYVSRYADDNPLVSGAVPDSALGLPGWLRRDARVLNYVDAGRAYVYLLPDSRPYGFSVARELARAAAVGFGPRVGIVSAGVVLPSGGGPAVHSVPAAVPDGALVLLL